MLKEQLFAHRLSDIVVLVNKNKKERYTLIKRLDCWLFFGVCRLEEQEKLVTAEGLYRRALSLDDLNPEAQEALHKITETIQVSGPQHAGSREVGI